MRARLLALASVLSCAGSGSPPPPSSPPPPAPPEPLVVVADAAAACHELRSIEESERVAAEVRAAQAKDPEPNMLAESRVKHGADRCTVADDSIASLEDAILAAPGPAASPPATPATAGPPRYLDLIDRRFLLDPRERAVLAKNGFVVPARLESPSYGEAFHDIFQSELPLFVTSDALLHAVFAGNDKVISNVETTTLEPLLRRALAEMTCALPQAANDYPRETATDLDLYLGVANSLFSWTPTEKKPTTFSDGSEIAAIASALTETGGLLGAPDAPPFTIFGRARVVDASLFAPRGHYTANLRQYFLAATWLSRLELNLSSRGSKSSHPGMAPDPSETPREELLALALADLAERSGALPLLERVDRAWSVLAGRREDVSLTDLVALRKKAGIASLKDAEAATKLRAAIGAGWKRTARTHFTPAGTTDLPVIATILGPRIGPDTAPTKRLVTDAIPYRNMLHATDMAYVLGNDRAKAWLADDLRQYPELARGLELARADAKGAMEGTDLYSAWLKSVAALSTPPTGPAPSFMATTAWADLRLDTMITGFGQIRHNYVLMAAGTYDAFGCQIPDAYVEPVPAMLDGIIDYARRGEEGMKAIDPEGGAVATAYFARVGKIMKVLRAIVGHELSGASLSDDEKRFLGMVADFASDYRCFDSCAPPTYTGWWYDLFIDRIADGTGTPEFIADYYASTNAGQVAYIGARPPRFGVFVVDVNGARRAMVGPVAHGFEYVGGLDNRLNDTQAHDLDHLVEPWAASYTVTAPDAPPLELREAPAAPKRVAKGLAPPPPAVPMPGPMIDPRATPRTGDIALVAQAGRPLGTVVVELLDHHRQPIASQSHTVGTKPVRYTFAAGAIRGGAVEVEGVRVRVGGASFTSTSSLYLKLPPSSPDG